MQTSLRVLGLLLVLMSGAIIVGCDGSGDPVSGASDPASEAVDAALAPEGVPSAAPEGTADTPPKPDAVESEAATEGQEAAGDTDSE